MKNCYIIALMLFSVLCFGQQKQFNINWSGYKVLETAYSKIEVPAFDDNHFSYNESDGLTFFAQWESNGSQIDENSIQLTNVAYESISASELKNLSPKLIPNSPKYKIYNTNARDKRAHYFELSPIIKDRGVYKKITGFTITYSTRSARTANNLNDANGIVNSVLSTGQWFRFYIEDSGVYRLSKSFLSSLGINTNSVDPRTIKIYGNGGRMLPLSNSENYPFDVVENAVKFIGEEDGSFDNNDYILFYGEGPKTYSEESETNLNIFTDKTYYYVNISSGNGKRIQEMPTIDASPDIVINTFQDYQYYEVDEYNLGKIGRRWFGDDFDIENQRSYKFEFPNLVTDIPVDFKIVVGSVSEVETTMKISINGNQVDNMGLGTISPGSVLATDKTHNNSHIITSDEITVTFDYSNNGNPSSNAFLDYINIEATRGLIYEGNQLVFKNKDVITTPGIAQYNLSNASAVTEIWDVTDRFNVTNLVNSTSENTITFKAQSGEQKTYIAFSNASVLQPNKDSRSSVANQNLKGTIFNNAQGQFEDIDYIILSPSQLTTQAERLAQINRDRYNLNVKVVDLETIYNEFSTGSQDVAAIRNFIKYVYDNASTPSKRLKYLCLFGEGSYDYKDRIRNNTNLVPSWYSKASFSLGNSFVSDDFYAMLDDNEGDGLTTSDRMDIAVGRILAEDVQRAKEMVDKINTYYQSESYGSWRNNVLLISDDVDEGWERNLQETTESLGNSLNQEKPFLNVVKIHSDAFEQESTAAGDRYPKVNEAIRDAIEVGALVVNYFGHGGEDGIAKERIFDKFDSQEVNNICKYNLFITVTCEYTKFDDPHRDTAGEFTFWNKNGGAIALLTTTRQISESTGRFFNLALDDYLYAFGSNDYPSIGEALRLTKTDNSIVGRSQKRLVFLIGDPAMKLAFAKPDIRLTKVNDVEITQPIDTLKALAYTKLAGEVVDANGNVLPNYNGTLTATVYDKPIERQTLGNDGVTDADGVIIMDYTTLGEVIFKGQASIVNGQFEFDFIVPRDIVIPVGNGKISFYAQTDDQLSDQAGANFDIKVGGINENAPTDDIGPVINLFMNDENFVSGGITNESPTLLVKLQDDNGINTASGIGHDITAIIDGDETNPIVLNNYYQASVDDYTNGTVSYPFRDLEPGVHTLTLKAWDVYNNSSTAEIQFRVFDEDEELIIDNVLNYPNPFVNYTEFWFNHNSSDPLDISVQIFTVTGKLVRTLNGQTSADECCSKGSSSLSRSIIWDGRDDFGDKIGKGVYVYKLKVKSNRLNKQVEKIQKLVIL
ncbi:type IX secretion system sortase PorU [Winogradskyella psychrotolerans]|uniref:type IX secretion system sortase PorU n=1 Tax=Winogradskyella psychrotolerans TaxID=1344585 RepID=UPI001C07B326|nr:type IX secretion system sortase PorU [Winogradskyella psychrotolerans]MBU2922266.1 type IX secretion system sortase PorU [Winogradskyella psychrotolerans]